MLTHIEKNIGTVPATMCSEGNRKRRTRTSSVSSTFVVVFLFLSICSLPLASALSIGIGREGSVKNALFTPEKKSCVSSYVGGGIPRTTVGSSSLRKQQQCQNIRDRKRVSLEASAAPSAVTSSMPRANLAVSLDRPLISPEQYYRRPGFFGMWKTFLAVVLSDVFKAAFVAFLLAFSISLFANSSNGLAIPSPQKIRSGLDYYYKLLKGRATRFWNKVRPVEKIDAVPMPFHPEDDGWGVCMLRSKEQIGRSPFVRYDFDLPRADYVLPLSLGQTITLCCLDESDNIVEGNFYTFKEDTGTFSIVLPEKNEEETEYDIGADRAKFAHVLKGEMGIGDEIALKPGVSTLNYRGQYLPVTDIVYVASGVGIVPILDQVKAVLPSGSSSVKGVSLVWINGDGKDFDVAINELEEEYFKYNTKLAVSCIGENVRKKALEENEEIEEAVPDFNPGTMAVISGPRAFSEKAKAYLKNRGYPEDCLCVLL
mmetsp:Transcript_10623/g.15659  ORF Transcript_10623/g.15659 Transcript_10623/m.15659 type:complete len:484 (+) Transcript_10623:187-1638(+)